MAEQILDSGKAWAKFLAICEAQGGFREPRLAPLTRKVVSQHTGDCVAVDNRRIAQVAKLAGAPQSCVAGVDLHVRLGQRVERGAPLYTIHAEAPGELEYALTFANNHPDILRVEPR
jgi:thymidine phosphorylase